MKKVYLSLLLAGLAISARSQTLFTYGSQAVSADEFMRAYNKNKTPVADKEKALRDYLELYTNFKLKVKAAADAGIDTLPQLKTDLENFRRQLAENYLNDEKGMKALLNEAHQRSQQDVRVSMISIPVERSIMPADTQRIYEQVQSLYNHIASGKEPDSFAEGRFRWRDVGFITAFTLPYQYENIVYSLPSGTVSKPYRSRNGWLMFKRTGERKNTGRWKIAQILFSYPPDADEASRAVVQQLADSVYSLIQSGASFADMARQYSNDKLTYLVGGEMPEFGTGKFDDAFESQVFALQKDGDVSRPFSTSFGVHIIRRIQHTATPSDLSDNTYQYELNQKIINDARASVAKDQFAREIRSKIGFKKLTSVKDADLYRYADSVAARPEESYYAGFPIAKKPVIAFTKSQVTGKDWLDFIAGYKANASQYKGESNEALWERFASTATLDYYRAHLDEFNGDYKYQVQEFREGNMLFEAMEKNVWSKAGADTVGLRKHYDANRSQYKWGPSADVLIVNCASENSATKITELLRKGDNWREIMETRPDEVQIDSGRYELAQLLGENNKGFPGKNSFSTFSRNSDGTTSFFCFLNEYGPDQQKSFDEARGLVINDYQLVVEKKWLDELKKKYPVKVNEQVFRSLLNQ